MTQLTKIESKDAPPAAGPYSQGIRAGNMLFLAGQIALVGDSGKLAEGGIVGQTEQVLKNIQAVLAAEKLNLANVVKTTVFLADIADWPAMNEVYARFFKAPYPARSAFQVARLPKDALVEIEVIAVAG